MWPIIPSSFPPTPRVKNRGLNICKTLCNSSTHFAYFNSWQKVDGQTSIVKFEHHSRAYLEGLTKFWGFWGSSVPPYSPFCTLKTRTFDLIPPDNPKGFHLIHFHLFCFLVHVVWVPTTIGCNRGGSSLSWVRGRSTSQEDKLGVINHDK